MAFAGGIGFRVDLATAPGARHCSEAEAAFGESTSRVIVSVAHDQVAPALGAAAAAGVPASVIGQAGGHQCIADGAFAVSLAEAEQVWREAIPNLMAKS
jgi:phosphoribosylformylglycinamidine synthase